MTTSVENFNQSENNQLKSDVSLPPSLTRVGIYKMVVTDKVMWKKPPQLYTTVKLLHRLGLKPKQGFERTEKQEGTIVAYSWFERTLVSTWQYWARKKRDKNRRLQMNLCTKKAQAWPFQEY